MDQKRIDEIYIELDTFNIDLPKDAYLQGPKKMNEILVDLRKITDNCEGLLREVSKAQIFIKKKLTNQRAIKRIEMDSLLADDDSVRKQKNQSMREAIAESKLKSLNLEIVDLEQLNLEFSALYDAVKSKYDNLNATRVDFNRMLNLLDMQIKLIPTDNLISNRDDQDLDFLLDENDLETVQDDIQRNNKMKEIDSFIESELMDDEEEEGNNTTNLNFDDMDSETEDLFDHIIDDDEDDEDDELDIKEGDEITFDDLIN